MAAHLFGIRHHGPGSARALLRALGELDPDLLLIEGPPEAQDLIPFAGDPAMRPPVALLLHVEGRPDRHVYFPFADFSPEWQAIRFALSHGIEFRFFDLPLGHQFALETDREIFSGDPLRELAEAAGFSDGEVWWENLIEQRAHGAGIFPAIAAAMSAVRTGWSEPLPHLELLRESWMRQELRAAREEGFLRIAAVCGAWHVPALDLDDPSLPAAEDDARCLKDLSSEPIRAAWIPWSDSRLSLSSGYGAGVESPGWSRHLWESGEEVAIRWMSRIAALLRAEDLEASPAQAIDAARAAEALAALRNLHRPGLIEMNEAALAVFCHGRDELFQLIRDRLIVGESVGSVPEDAPAPPLADDWRKESRRLRLPVEGLDRILDLDLRKELDLERSRFLHRLKLLGIDWGAREEIAVRGSSFREIWRLRWTPEMSVALNQAGIRGLTVRDAAAAKVREILSGIDTLPELGDLLDRSMPADLPETVEPLVARLELLTIQAPDVEQLMKALPALARVFRYGNVRGVDPALIAGLIDGMMARVCIGLPQACLAASRETAPDLMESLQAVDRAVKLLEDEEPARQWREALRHIVDLRGAHGLLAGRGCLLLLRSGGLAPEEARRIVSLALSRAANPLEASAWIEGFLAGEASLLVHDDSILSLLNQWLTGIPEDHFRQCLPLLRRTFSTFSMAERRRIGERLGSDSMAAAEEKEEDEFVEARAALVLPTLARLLGLKERLDESR